MDGWLLAVYTVLPLLCLWGGMVFGWKVATARRNRLPEAVDEFLKEAERMGYPPCWPGPCTPENCRTPGWCNRLATLYLYTDRPRPRVGPDGRPVGAKVREGRMV